MSKVQRSKWSKTEAERIAMLPAMTQANILTELQNDPEQVQHIKMLLAQPNPAVAIIKDQEITALNVVKPGLYPEAKGNWPVFQGYFRKNYGLAVKRAATKGKGVSGLGAEAEAAALKTAATGATSAVAGDWGSVLGSAMSIALNYGVPAIQKAAAKKAEKTQDKRAKRLLEQAAKQEISGAKQEQLQVAAQSTEVAKVSPDMIKAAAPETGKKEGPNVGLMVGGAAAVLVALLAFTKRR